MIGVVAAASAALVFAGAGSAVAAAGSPSPAPDQQPPGGGWDHVIAKQAVGPGGGFLGPVRSAGMVVTLRIPAGTFASTVEVTLTEPDLEALVDIEQFIPVDRFRVVSGVGLRVEQNGHPYTGDFREDLEIFVQAAFLSDYCIPIRWNGAKWVDSGGSFHAGMGHLSLLRPGNYAVITADI